MNGWLRPLECCNNWMITAVLSFASVAPIAANDLSSEISPARMTPLVQAIRKVRPSVVNIHSEKSASATPNPIQPGAAPRGKLSGMGTGVVVDERGYIVTNYHVIEDVSSIRVTLVDGATHTAEVVARDPEIDLALLKVEPASKLPVMPMGTSSDLLHGETVFAIGNAYGYEHTITLGIISELHRDVRLSETQSYRDLIQTDASINPGNSGGPLVNADGEMIGLNVAIRAGAQGIGFAIPADELQRVLVKLFSSRRSASRHGLTCRSLGHKPGGGLVVDQVEPGSPAEAAGIKAGDKIVKVGQIDMTFAYDLERALLGAKDSDPVAVELTREGEPQELPLSIKNSTPVKQSAPLEVVWNRLGLRLLDGSDGVNVRTVSGQLRGGLRIVDVSTSSPADKAGIRAGDVLVGLHHWETLSVENVVYVLKQPQASSPMRFYVIRGDQIHRGWLDPAGAQTEALSRESGSVNPIR